MSVRTSKIRSGGSENGEKARRGPTVTWQPCQRHVSAASAVKGHVARADSRVSADWPVASAAARVARHGPPEARDGACGGGGGRRVVGPVRLESSRRDDPDDGGG